MIISKLKIYFLLTLLGGSGPKSMESMERLRKCCGFSYSPWLEGVLVYLYWRKTVVLIPERTKDRNAIIKSYERLETGSMLLRRAGEQEDGENRGWRVLSRTVVRETLPEGSRCVKGSSASKVLRNESINKWETRWGIRSEKGFTR